MDKTLLLMCFVLVLSQLRSVCAKNFTGLYIFGDSSVDAGNNQHRDTHGLARADFSPFGQDFINQEATGRHTNGFLVIDFIAQHLNLTDLPLPYLDPNNSNLGVGVNFGSARSGILNDTGIHQYGQVIPLTDQLMYFREDTLSKLRQHHGANFAHHVANSLIYISAGNNDWMEFFTGNNEMINNEISQFEDNLLRKFRNIIQDFYSLGLRKFVIAEVQPLGCMPFILEKYNATNTSGDCISYINKRIVNYNRKLRAIVKDMLEQDNGIQEAKVFVAPVYNVTHHAIKNLSGHGFDRNTACCGGGAFNGQTYCQRHTVPCNSARKLPWWDAFHASQALNRFIAHELFWGKFHFEATIFCKNIFHLIFDYEITVNGGSPSPPSSGAPPSPSPTQPASAAPSSPPEPSIGAPLSATEPSATAPQSPTEPSIGAPQSATEPSSITPPSTPEPSSGAPPSATEPPLSTTEPSSGVPSSSTEPSIAPTPVPAPLSSPSTVGNTPVVPLSSTSPISVGTPPTPSSSSDDNDDPLSNTPDPYIY